MDVTIGACGRVPAAEVWERYVVPARWPEWAPQIVRVAASTARIVRGTTGQVHGPLGLRVDFTVTEVDEAARTWAWDVVLGLLRLHLRHGVELDGAGSSTWLAVRGPAPVLTVYLPVARIALHRLVHRSD